MGTKKEYFVSLHTPHQVYVSAGAAAGLGSLVDVRFYEKTIALVSSPLGRYKACGKSGKTITSKELADWLAARFPGERRLPAWRHAGADEGVLLFGEDGGDYDPEVFKPLELDYARLGDLYLLDGKGWSFYISACAAAMLGGRVSVYTSGDYLALAGDPVGELPISGADPKARHTVSSEALKTLLRRRYRGVAKLWLIPCGEMLLVTDSPIPPRRRDLPDARAFRRLELEHHADGGQWAALEVDRVRLSKAAAVNLGSAVSVYDAGDAVVLLNDPEGRNTIPVYKGNMKALLSRALARFLEERFQTEPAGTLGACPLKNGAALYGRGGAVALIEPDAMTCINTDLLLQQRKSVLSVNVCRNRISFSARASDLLNEHVTVLQSDRGRCVKIVPDPRGSHRVRKQARSRGRYLDSKALAEYLPGVLGCSLDQAEISALPAGGLLLRGPFSGQPGLDTRWTPAVLPTAAPNCRPERPEASAS